MIFSEAANQSASSPSAKQTVTTRAAMGVLVGTTGAPFAAGGHGEVSPQTRVCSRRAALWALNLDGQPTKEVGW
ncbi:hypothetical protein GCM10009687_05760 [Asanoa iriomotensis]